MTLKTETDEVDFREGCRVGKALTRRLAEEPPK